jgi:hypothetical protein
MKISILRPLAAAMLLVGMTTAWAGSATLTPVGPATFRWLDIGDYLYGANFRSTFSYGTGVTLTYPDSDSSFVGTLSGSGLKPNFAYQLKFEGIPKLSGGTDQDEWANAQLGKAGRWWVTVLDGAGSVVAMYNYDNQFGATGDDRYDELAKTDFYEAATGYTYIFKGYLLFDYVVTTSSGAIPGGTGGWSFIVDSSFHVLFKTTQGGWDANDATPTSHTISFTRAYYDTLRTSKTISLYGEWQPGRARPGQLLLPLGSYNVRLVLTEESFHSTSPQGGNWAAALTAPVAFTIAPPPPPPGTLAGTVKTTSGKAIAKAAVTVRDLDGLSVASALTGSTGKYSIAKLPAGSYAVTVSATGYKAVTVATTIVSGATTTLDVRLAK